MNKRGEIYILAAILLAVILYGLATTMNYAKKPSVDEDFDKISKNYEIESNKLINNLLSQGEEINRPFNIFTALFTSYSKSQNPSYGLVYTLSFDYTEEVTQTVIPQIQVGNYFDKPLCIQYDETTEEVQGCFERIPVTLSFDGLNLDPVIEQQIIEDCTLILDYTVSTIEIGIPEEGAGCGDPEIVWYDMKIEQGKPQIMIISHLQEGEQRSVFVGGEGFVEPS